ncbi:helix-turn-helix domain-containing protein [Gordonia sp. DT30]|uniref:AraC family transcriptional regulator n=1 Tax=Gordonia sp. DT30 TaxID=3416546 RepID=UPI003CE98792
MLYSRKLTHLTTRCDLYPPSELRWPHRPGAEKSPYVYVFLTGLPGRFVVRSGHEQRVYEPGELVIVSSAQPLSVAFSAPADPTGFVIGLDVLGGDRFSRGGLVVPQSLLSRAASHFVRGLAHAAAAHQDPIGPDVEQAAIELVRAVVACEGSELNRVRDHSVMVRAAAADLIESRCTDPEFGVADIARELRISRRHLYRHFAGSSQSLSDLISVRRMVIARELLDAQESHTLGEVASASGFGTVATLRSHFRATHDMTPTEYQRQSAIDDRTEAPPSARSPARPVLDPVADESQAGAL